MTTRRTLTINTIDLTGVVVRDVDVRATLIAGYGEYPSSIDFFPESDRTAIAFRSVTTRTDIEGNATLELIPTVGMRRGSRYAVTFSLGDDVSDPYVISMPDKDANIADLVSSGLSKPELDGVSRADVIGLISVYADGSGDPEGSGTGWSPELSVVEDGDRRVIEIAGWTGGTGAEPSSGIYIGDDGWVEDIAEATDIRGDVGPKGDKGDKGDRGDKGDKGDRGDTGIQGPRGDVGDRGLIGPKGDKGDTGDRGDTGIQGPKGDDGDRGLIGPKGDKGDRGDTGLQGPKGEEGDTGSKGDKGDKGERGDTGIQGPKGDEGDRGVPGVQGEQGERGERGEKGDRGERGVPGEKGSTGDQGYQGIYSIEIYRNSSESLTSVPIGGLYDTDTGALTPPDLWSRDITPSNPGETAYISKARIDPGRESGVVVPAWGIPSIAGSQGPTGPEGEKGDKGDQGDPGLQGEKGDKGDPGLQGEKGDKGDTGDRGLRGEKGDSGEKGDTGSQGIQGEKGDKGDRGDQGIQGEKGDKGDPGAGTGEIADNSIEPIKAKAGTAAEKQSWRDRFASSHISAGDSFIDLTETNLSDIRVITQDIASGVSFVDISDPSTVLTSASAGDVMMVVMFREKVWARVGNILKTPNTGLSENLLRHLSTSDVISVELASEAEARSSEITASSENYVWEDSGELSFAQVVASSSLGTRIAGGAGSTILADVQNLLYSSDDILDISGGTVYIVGRLSTRRSPSSHRLINSDTGTEIIVPALGSVIAGDENDLFYDLGTYSSALAVKSQIRTSVGATAFEGDLGGRALTAVNDIIAPLIDQLDGLDQSTRDIDRVVDGPVVWENAPVADAQFAYTWNLTSATARKLENPDPLSPFDPSTDITGSFRTSGGNIIWSTARNVPADSIILVRVKRGLSPIQFRTRLNAEEHILWGYQYRGHDASWDYYFGGSTSGSSSVDVAIQKRAQSFHTAYHGDLAGRALEQIEQEIADAIDPLTQKIDSIDKLDFDTSPDYWVSGDSEARNYVIHLQGVNVVDLPNVSKVTVRLAGSILASRQSFDPADSDIAVEVSETEARNTNNNIRNRPSIQMDLEFLDASNTLVRLINRQIRVLSKAPVGGDGEVATDFTLDGTGQDDDPLSVSDEYSINNSPYRDTNLPERPSLRGMRFYAVEESSVPESEHIIRWTPARQPGAQTAENSYIGFSLISISNTPPVFNSGAAPSWASLSGIAAVYRERPVSGTLGIVIYIDQSLGVPTHMHLLRQNSITVPTDGSPVTVGGRTYARYFVTRAEGVDTLEVGAEFEFSLQFGDKYLHENGTLGDHKTVPPGEYAADLVDGKLQWIHSNVLTDDIAEKVGKLPIHVIRAIRQQGFGTTDVTGVESLTLPVNYMDYTELELIVSDPRGNTTAFIRVPTIWLSLQVDGKNPKIAVIDNDESGSRQWLTWTPSTRTLGRDAQQDVGVTNRIQIQSARLT